MANDIKVYPVINNVRKGEIFKINIQNDSQKDISVTITPIYLKVLTKSLEQSESIKNLSSWLTLSDTKFNIKKNSKQSINTKILKFPENNLIGYVVRQINGDGKQVDIRNGIVVIANNQEIDEANFKKLNTEFSVKPQIGIQEVNLSSFNLLSTEITNNSSQIVNSNGKIEIYSEDLLLKSISLTPSINSTIYPGELVKIEENFLDTRPFWKRVGQVTYTQKLYFNDQVITKSQTLLNLPVEFGLLVIILLGGLFFVVRRMFRVSIVKRK